jgi:hypothetical protein
MTLQPEQKLALDDALLESLLHQAYVGDPKEQQRISQMLASLEASERTSQTSLPKSRMSWNRWVSLALAASVLLVAAYLSNYFAASDAAYAAVMRSLDVTPATRAYQIRMVHQRPIWGQREVTADLYLNDRDQFVVRHPGWSRFGDVWIGGDAKNRWIAPRFGPAYVGGDAIVGGWLSRKDLPSPYLHVSTILERMSRAYQLTMRDDETLPRGDALERSIRCQHIVGKLRGSNRSLPATIELWADIETGMAHRLNLTWQRGESERGPVLWIMDWVGSPELPSNWFEIEGHTTADREIISLESTAELDAAEIETR